MSDAVLPQGADDEGPPGSTSVTVVIDEWLRHVAGFVPIRAWQLPDLVGHKPRVSGEALRLYVILGQHARRVDRTAWPSNARLATILGTSTRTVQRWLGELLTAGWVTSETSTTRGAQGHAATKRTLRLPLERGVTPPRHPCHGVATPVSGTPMTQMSHHPDESDPDDLNPHPDGGAPPMTAEETGDLAASLWSAIQEALLESRMPIRGAPSAAHAALRAFFQRPGFAPEPAQVVRALKRDAAKWVARAADERAARSPDPWRFAPSLAKWIAERRWEIPDDPEPPAPAATASTPGVSTRELARRDEEARERKERAQRDGPAWLREGRERGLLDERGNPVRGPTPVADAVGALLRRKGPPA